MGLYQRSVLKNYLFALDDSKVNAAYEAYSSIFLNKERQQNIKRLSERQHQGGFLRDLFVNSLGYTISPDANYNLISEQKNVSDAKTADGAILIDGKVIGVIELKGTNTIDLGKIQQQAFYYLSAHPEAVYVITSNFEKLRFYIQKSNDYEEFNLFTLTYDEFKLLYLCVSLDSISTGLPLKIKQDSLLKEEIITKQLYKDYSNFKSDLFTSLCERNNLLDKLTLFKATQKLIDRFLFIFFCEDNNGLLPANSIAEIIKHWNKLREMDEYKPLYDIFKKYFEYINSGRAAAGDKREIFAFNGGLFAEDKLLDTLNIDDDVLYTHTQKLSTYDFISEVDVNILGHIFEHSLNDIEEIQAELAGDTVDKSKTKRKKDGVFYTPKYITEYIVENTVGKLCADKKAALEIDEDLFVSATTKAKREPLLAKLNAYKSYLLSITICDPACGSGAFLNQAYVFLQKEHQYVADLESKLFDAPMVISDVSADILENNLFGVDINEESVEIARLALWLRSAKKGRKLNNLSNNIKCGNSLIDDPKVAGDKAFNWEKEFPQVFKSKELEAFHVVLTTHNSRTSHRMIKYNILPENPVELNTKEEIILTKIIAEIVKEKNYKIMAYNICKDHVHLIIVCEFEELNDIVKTIKGKSAYEFNKMIRGNGLKPIGKEAAPDGFQSNGDDTTSIGFQPTDGVTISSGFQPIAEIKTIEIDTKFDDFKPIEEKNRNTYNPYEHNGHLWSQKFFRANLDVWTLAELSPKAGYIYKDTYLDNAVSYIQNNRQKHQLPENKELTQLIDEMTISDDDAFAPQYKGGFDVVIGNPPYVNSKNDSINESMKGFFLKTYLTSVYQIELYILFVERSKKLINSKGIISYIIPNAWMNNLFQIEVRKFVLNNFNIIEIVSMQNNTFEQAMVDTVIIFFDLNINNILTKLKINDDINFTFVSEKSQYDWLQNKNCIISTTSNNLISGLLEKINSKCLVSLGEISEIARGVGVYHKRVGHTKEFIDSDPYQSNSKLNDSFVPYIRGKHVTNYYLSWNNDSFISYGNWLAEPREPKYFVGERIILRQIPGKRLISTIITEQFVIDQSVFISKLKPETLVKSKFILSLISSKLYAFYFRNTYSEFDELFPKLKLQHFKDLPIIIIEPFKQIIFIELVDKMLIYTNKINGIKLKFLSRIQSNLHLQNITGKLEKFYEHDFKSFVGELKKQKVTLSLKDQDEWEDYFNSYKKDINDLQAEIARTDKEIDQMVYELYGLTDEEIRVVEAG